MNETVLADIVWHGKERQALYHADRNGQFVVLDRRTGKLIYAVPFVKTNAVLGYGADGAAVIDPAARLHDGPPPVVCPSSIGGKNWWPTAYDPVTRRAFIPVSHMCMTMTRTELEDRPGVAYLGVDEKLVAEPGASGFGEVLAIDVDTGAKVWSHASALPWNDGMLATAGGLVFSGSADRTFMAFDARDGKVLWSYRHELRHDRPAGELSRRRQAVRGGAGGLGRRRRALRRSGRRGHQVDSARR